MSEPIKLIVEAQTDEAAAKLQALMNQSGVQVSQFKAGSKALKETADAAKTAGVHLAGMSYYARSGIDAIRLAAADGGARAGFYAIDEAIRGVISSGVALGTLVPVLGGIAAVAGAGYLIWREYSSAEREAAETAKKHAEAIKGVADGLKLINELEKAGHLGPGAAAEFKNYLGENPKKKLYVQPDGSIGPNPTAERRVQNAPTFGTVPTFSNEIETINLKQASPDQVMGYLKDHFSEAEQIQADTVLKLRELDRAAMEERLKGIDKEISKNHDEFEKKREAIIQIEELAKKQGALTPALKQKDIAAINALAAGEAEKNKEIIAKAVEERNKKNLELEKQRAEVLNRLAAAREKELKALEDQERLERKIAEDKARGKDQMILAGDSTPGEQLNAAKDLARISAAELEENRIKLEGNITQQERNNLLREQGELQLKNAADNDRVAALEKQINKQRVQAVYEMFGNMGAAAKMYGKTGFEVYKGFAIAQATMDTYKAAIAAYNSVVGIPYVGPVLAPVAAAAAVAFGVAQIAQIESASPREHGGPVEAGKLYMTGERGRELFVPDTDGRILDASTTRNVMRGGGRSAAAMPHINFQVLQFTDMGAVNKHARENPEFHHIIVGIGQKNAHFIPARS